jgi:hypothetical protein
VTWIHFYENNTKTRFGYSLAKDRALQKRKFRKVMYDICFTTKGLAVQIAVSKDKPNFYQDTIFSETKPLRKRRPETVKINVNASSNKAYTGRCCPHSSVFHQTMPTGTSFRFQSKKNFSDRKVVKRKLLGSAISQCIHTIHKIL